ncbi:MAG: 2-succinyl-5-enolpyruvyl-6-hydroxy-3-cyclohexene-1-carboxylic-acid synthase [Bacteroidota bacterium]
MKFSSKILSQTIVQLCRAKEIEHVVISPGSRSAPLTIGFTEDPYFTNYSIVDERCAAFFALGLAQQLHKPVALVCTSGSALLNYYPAIAEAFYSDIPLVILSADRPAHLIDIGDGQTIRQPNVFANHICYSGNCREGEEHQAKNEQVINAALNTALREHGPVHINVPFSEPLYDTVNTPDVIPEDQSIDPKLPSAMSQEIDRLKDDWTKAGKIMVLIGVLPPGQLDKALVEFLGGSEQVIVFTETTSNVHHEHFFPAIDQLIAPLDEAGFQALQPELLITLGGMVVSKKIKAFLRNYPPRRHYHVHEKRAQDTFFVLNDHLALTPQTALQNLLDAPSVSSSSYRTDWLAVREHRLRKHDAYLAEIAYSDFTVFAELFQAIPKHRQLQLANSATVRYAQLFSLDPSWEVFCNRGTSGIDGSTSTAIGASLVSEEPVVFLTGDLSFFYDSNALWNAYVPNNFRIIVINNGGGGIFRILPGANDTDNFNTYFETKHELTARQLAAMYGWDYSIATDTTSLRALLSEFFAASEQPKILEVFTPSGINDQILLGYFEYIK